MYTEEQTIYPMVWVVFGGVLPASTLDKHQCMLRTMYRAYTRQRFLLDTWGKLLNLRLGITYSTI